MFTGKHFVWIGLCVAFVAVLLVLSIRFSFSLHRAGLIMTVICVLSESSKMMSEMIPGVRGGMVLDPLALPFHLCSLLLFGVVYITFAKESPAKQHIIDFMAVAGTLGSICALLIPTNGVDFLSIGAYQCFVYHGGLLWFSFYLIVSKKANLGLRALFSNLGILLLLVLMNFYVNSFLSAYGSNFMYLVRPPMENLPFLNLDKGWYVYFLRIVVLAMAALTLFHLPFIVRERRIRR